MSYILEALKKSEQERALGSVPGLVTAQEQTPSRRPRWLWPIVIILALNVVFLIGLLLRSQQEVPLEQKVVQETNALETVAAYVPETLPVMESAPEIERVPATPEPEPAQAFAPPPKPSEPKPAEPEPTKPENNQKQAVSGGSVVFAERPLDGGDWTQQSQQGVDAPAEQVEEDIPLWRELPSDIRRAVPEFRLDVHVYADEPEGRFVLIQLQKFREGDSLEGGIRLERITPEGVVFNYHGDRFLVTKQ